MANEIQNNGRSLLPSLKYIKALVLYALGSQQEKHFIVMMSM